MCRSSLGDVCAVADEATGSWGRPLLSRGLLHPTTAGSLGGHEQSTSPLRRRACLASLVRRLCKLRRHVPHSRRVPNRRGRDKKRQHPTQPGIDEGASARRGSNESSVLKASTVKRTLRAASAARCLLRPIARLWPFAAAHFGKVGRFTQLHDGRTSLGRRLLRFQILRSSYGSL